MINYKLKPKIKICFLIKSHYSHTMGGAELHAKTVIESLAKRNDYKIYYFCRNYAANYKCEDYQIVDVGNFLGNIISYFDIFTLLYYLIKIKPDIIYQKGAHSYSGIAAFYSKYFGSKFIWHVSSDSNVRPVNLKNFRDFFTKIFDKILLKYGILNASIILGQTKKQNELLKKYYGRECDSLIPPGHQICETKILKSEKKTIIWVGNFRKVKRPEVFVKLVKAIDSANDISFVMIGGFVDKTDNYEYLMKEIKLLKNLSFLGPIPQEEVNNRLLTGHILVNTSEYEGFSNTFIQAWLREVPVISLNVDPDNILVNEKIGLLSKSFRQLVDDVVSLSKNEPLRESMGKRARFYAEDRYTNTRMIDDLLRNFEGNKN